MRWTVYKHITPNGGVYIGITSTSPEIRWGVNGVNYKDSRYFWNAIQKYGWKNIKHQILFSNLSKEVAEKLEEDLIIEYRKLGICYNIRDGGNVSSPSEETKELLRQVNLGKKHSLETRTKMSNSRKGLINNKGRTVKNITTGEVFESLSAAARAYGVDRAAITACCQGIYRKSAGCDWKYL